MNEPSEHEPLDADSELLSAYLDGELDDATRESLTARLDSDAGLRTRLEQHRQAWNLLDDLVVPVDRPDLTASTIELVTTQLAQGGWSQTSRTKVWAKRSIAIAMVLACGILGYALVTVRTHAPYRELARDLPLLKQLDEYRYSDDIDFLRALADEQLFPSEEIDEP